MTWDVTLPPGTEAISNGDDRIRELKTDLQTSFRGNASDGTEAKFPGSDTANPIFRYRGLKDTTSNRPSAGQYGLFFDTTRNALQRDNGSSWDDIGTLIPSGTVCVFYQAAAPTGWTQVTTDTDKALRVVSGTGGGSGGSTAFSSAFSGGHVHTLADEGSVVNSQNAPYFGARKASGSGNTTTALLIPDGTAGSINLQPVQWTTNSTTVTFSPKYIDVIVASKN